MATDPALDLDVPADSWRSRRLTAVDADRGRGTSTDPGGSTIGPALPHRGEPRPPGHQAHPPGVRRSGRGTPVDAPEQSWAAVIERAAAGGHVVQERVPIITEEYTVLEEGFLIHRFNVATTTRCCVAEGGRLTTAPGAGDPGITNVTGGGVECRADVHPHLEQARVCAAVAAC